MDDPTIARALRRATAPRTYRYAGYLWAAVAVTVCMVIVWALPPINVAESDTSYLMTFAGVLLAAGIISVLAGRQREAHVLAQQREERNRLLYALSQAYAASVGVEAVRAAAAEYLGTLFSGQVVVLLPRRGAEPIIGGDGAAPSLAARVKRPETEVGVAQWVFEHDHPAGVGTNILPGAAGLYLPLIGTRGRVGVLGLRRAGAGGAVSEEQFQLLQACASQTALAIERALLVQTVQCAEVAAASERAHTALLASVSHELRTPLAVVMGVLGGFLEHGPAIDPATRVQLTKDAYHETVRLNYLVEELLAMTRLEAGTMSLQVEWQSVEELIGAALARLDEQLAERPVAVSVSSDLPLLQLDGRLVSQVIVHLLDNALAHTPPAALIQVRAELVPDRCSLPAGDPERIALRHGPAVLIEVADDGPGLPPGDEARVFEKFYRGPNTRQRGVGLGLAICRSIIDAHGGAIWAEAERADGARFRFWLPIDRAAPELRVEEGHEAEQRPWRKAS